MNDDAISGIEVVEGRFDCPGTVVGHATEPGDSTGCTVVVLPGSSPYHCNVMGGATSMRQVAALTPGHSVTRADAFLISGGSAFGLDASGGVLRALERQGRGTRIGPFCIPAVPAVALFDLFASKPGVRPGPECGERAVAAAEADSVQEGRVGAGRGCTVGKILGIDRAMWGGVGLATAAGPGGLRVATLAVVNAFGNVLDPATGEWVAGARDGNGGFVDVEQAMLAGALAQRRREMLSGNTTICVVVTNAALDPGECLRASVLGGQALVRAIRPCQTAMDGDVVFVASAGDVVADSHQVGVAAARALERAIVRAARAANPAGGVPPASRKSPDGNP